MQRRRTLLALSLALAAGNTLAQPPSPASDGLLPVPANRIVGHWRTEVTLAPCSGGPARSFIGFNTYHAGGTLSDTGTNLPPGLRSPGHGTWRYQGRAQYRSRFQVFRFTQAGEYDGYADVRTSIVLNARATQYAQTINARQFDRDGVLQVELCGSSNAERIAIQ